MCVDMFLNQLDSCFVGRSQVQQLGGRKRTCTTIFDGEWRFAKMNRKCGGSWHAIKELSNPPFLTSKTRHQQQTRFQSLIYRLGQLIGSTKRVWKHRSMIQQSQIVDEKYWDVEYWLQADWAPKPVEVWDSNRSATSLDALDYTPVKRGCAELNIGANSQDILELPFDVLWWCQMMSYMTYKI